MQAGDLVFCRTTGIIGKAIRVAQHFDGDGKYSKWNHVAVLDRQDSAGNWLVIQAEPKGVTNDKYLDDVAPGGNYEILALPQGANQAEFLKFIRFQIGFSYGFISILSCAIDILLPNSICLRKANTWICSGLVAAGLMFSGFTDALTWPDLYTRTPAQIARVCQAN